MGFYVNPPADGFAEVLANGMYVDKSKLIAYTNKVLGTSDKLTASTRPRRFGKSFAAKMLAAYYSKGADSKALFENLKIAETDYEKHLNKYDVLFIDVASFIAMSENVRDTVADIQSEVIAELKETYPGCIRENTRSLLKALMQVHASTGNKFFVVIDEWDALFREAKDDEEVQKAYIQLLRSMFKSSQTPQIFVGAYMTGILPIKKYGTQSALTDFKEYTMLEPGPLASLIGFTEDEVKNLCDANHLDFTETQKWYDGYQFDTVVMEKMSGNQETGSAKPKQHNIIQHIYCPNSIMELIERKKFGSYWTKTETYESLRDYIDLNYDGLKDALVDMLGGKRCRIDVETFQNDMTSIGSRDDIFTLLVHLGYLAYDSNRKEVFIPNEEVRGEFIRAVKEGKRQEFEELASGRGYSDILFLPRPTSRKPALLIELKWDKSVEKAITQIVDKQYREILKKFDYEGKVLLIGINYSTKTGKHTCKIEG
ncbi:MAG: AAA family ATPase [Eubacteriales bacterium]|nr:AAA family ATPase [Eubacteriales bacterium]